MVHRDIKPANCLFVDGRLKLADFGLLTDNHCDVSTAGTRRYMPPDGRMDARADVYAAGLTIYEMMTGHPVDCFPMLGDSSEQIANQPQLVRLNRSVLQACQTDPRDRFTDGRQMLKHLDETANGHGGARLRRITITVGVVLLFCLVSWFILNRDQGDVLPHPKPVKVNFVTRPFEATIEIDGEPLLKPDGTAYTTPCTVSDLSAEIHHVVFKHDQLGVLDAGQVDFANRREIECLWNKGGTSATP